MKRVAIIGTANRNYDARMTREVYDMMVDKAAQLISEQFPNGGGGEEIMLVSGGSAWCDHIAVTLFLQKKCSALLLYLPCTFDEKFDPTSNSGAALNQYHTSFCATTTIDSFAQIKESREKGAILNTASKSFLARNNLVANDLDYAIAFTMSKTKEPNEGGTAYTWKRIKCKKVHIRLFYSCLFYSCRSASDNISFYLGTTKVSFFFIVRLRRTVVNWCR